MNQIEKLLAFRKEDRSLKITVPLPMSNSSWSRRNSNFSKIYIFADEGLRRKVEKFSQIEKKSVKISSWDGNYGLLVTIITIVIKVYFAERVPTLAFFSYDHVDFDFEAIKKIKSCTGPYVTIRY